MSDMERGRLISQHGASSQVVANYDSRVAEREHAEASWRAIEAASATSPGNSGTPTSGAGVAGAGGEALGKLLAFALLMAGLYGLYLFAAEAVRTLGFIWREAVLGVGASGHLGLTLSLMISVLAIWSGLRCLERYRNLRLGVRIAALFVAIPVGQILLWLAGNVMLALPLVGPLMSPLPDWLSAHLPEIETNRLDIAADIATATIAAVGVSLTIPLWQIIERGGTAAMGRLIELQVSLARRGLTLPLAIAGATMILLASFAMPTPPLAMPFGIWLHGAIIVGLMFGWRVSLSAILLAVAIGQPGYDEASAMFRDGSALRRIALWWSGLIVTAAAAGLLRPSLPSTPVEEMRTAVLATCVGLVVGCLTMLVIELAELGSRNLWQLFVDYWVRFLPPYALGYAVSIGIGSGVSVVIRNLGHRWQRLAEEGRVAGRAIQV
ncbi:hypothetical protein [Roseomonas fluvialis]|uniref:Uncharacterized protein n=1 Tax=Roseomonas fluvialis TaxID=1750527 RepID=A0ABM7XYG9_9PROT|nr:hypothetical protein [Roseomonas fluvialis]BDG70502.1 hypothetical protein Rmf_04310 [Roseomonas fluvialis]